MERQHIPTSSSSRINGQRGSVTMAGLFIAFVLSGILLHLSIIGIREFKRRQEIRKISLCARNHMANEKNFTTTINKINWLLANATKIQLVAIFFPGIAAVAGKGIEEVKRALKAYQYFELISYLKKIAEFKLQSCPVGPEAFKTPYEISAKGFQRDYLGRTKIRATQWKIKLNAKTIKIELKYTLKDNEDTSILSRAWLDWKISSGYF